MATNLFSHSLMADWRSEHLFASKCLSSCRGRSCRRSLPRDEGLLANYSHL